MTVTVAALFVDAAGIYSTLEGVECWGVERDARTYDGSLPVVAHPPCQRWGRYATGGPRYPRRFAAGDDEGCFAAALASVRRCGGVLEHPAGSKAWSAFGLIAPPPQGGWIAAGDWQGWTCCVEQGHYGHRARKATWLYAVARELPSLRWGSCLAAPSPAAPARFLKPPAGLSVEDRNARRAWLAEHERVTGKTWVCAETMGKKERAATPAPFANLLVDLARGARRQGHR